MSRFRIVTPEATTNYFTDPRFGASALADNWTVAGDGSPSAALTSASQFVGLKSACLSLGGGTLTTLYGSLAASATSTTLSFYARRNGGGTMASTHIRGWFDNGAVTLASLIAEADGWYQCIYTGTPTAGTRQFGVRALENGLVVDGFQLEQKAYNTTYTDGDLEGSKEDGYQWTGIAHNSTSTRSSQERNGGRVQDVVDSLGARVVMGFAGGGAPPVTNNESVPVNIPGTIYEGTRTNARFLDLNVMFTGASAGIPHDKRTVLWEAIKPNKVTPKQPFRLQYQSGSSWREIDTVYQDGLGNTGLAGVKTEIVGLRLKAHDPDWREFKDNAASINGYSGSTFNYIAINSDGWKTASPGMNGNVNVVFKALNNNWYAFGDFTSPCNYAAEWNGTTWTALGTLASPISQAAQIPNGDVYALSGSKLLKYSSGSWATAASAGYSFATTYGANGTIYAAHQDSSSNIYFGGDFSAIGGIAACAIAKYTPSTGSWSALGSGLSTSVRAITSDGASIYAGGTFLNASGIAGADRIAKWDGNGWSAVGDTTTAALDGPVYALLKTSAGIAVGGGFTSACGQSSWVANALWTGASWSSLLTGLSEATVYALVIHSGSLYLGGQFTYSGGTATNLAASNGSPLGSATTFNGVIRALASISSSLYAGGNFTNASAVGAADYIAKWDGTGWAQVGDAGGAALTDEVYSLTACGTNLYVGGAFSNASGLGGADSFALWNGSIWNTVGASSAFQGATVFAGASSASGIWLGSNKTAISGSTTVDYGAIFDSSNFQPLENSISACPASFLGLTVDNNSNVYAGGFFIQPASGLLQYTGAASADIGSIPAGSIIKAMAIDTDNNLYIAGCFVTVNGVSASGIAKYDGASWYSVGSGGPNGAVNAIAINPTTQDPYIGGPFSSVKGTSACKLGHYSGGVWRGIDTGLATNDTIRDLHFDENGNMFVSGQFSSIGGINLTNGAAKYDGNSFISLGIVLPSSPSVLSIYGDVSKSALGFSTSGTGATPGSAVVLYNQSTTDTFPKLYISGSGILEYLKHRETGKAIYFNSVSVGASETVVLDLGRFAKTLVSNIRGDLTGKISVRSNLSDFALIPGTNTIEAFINGANASGNLLWKVVHDSFDGNS